MSDEEYIKELERRNDELNAMLEDFVLIKDILKSKVHILQSSFFNLIHPKQLCDYMEKLGWTMKYEKIHERFVTRSYISPHKDVKCKVFMQDLNASAEQLAGNYGGSEKMINKTKEVINLLARIHNKGELEVIFEIFSKKAK